MPSLSILKSLPGVQVAVHRWLKPHVHEEGLQVVRSSFLVLRSSFIEVFEEQKIQSVLECTVSGASVFGERAPKNVSLRVTTPLRRFLLPNRQPNPDRQPESDSSPSLSFLNLMYSRLPRVDAVVVLDYFDQIPDRDIQQILSRVRKAGICWLFATHYPCLNSNWDTYVGEWRPINLTLKPYPLSEPIRVIPDPDPERRPDRSIGVFDLREKLKAWNTEMLT